MDAFADRIAACTATLRTACEAAGIVPRGDGRVSETEEALLLGCSLRTVQRMRADGSGPLPTRVGGRWFTTIEAIATYSVLGTGFESSSRYYSAPQTRQKTTKRDSYRKRTAAG